MHGYYTYTPGDVLTYSSSDDLWVFVNNTLVVDLGGVHTAPRTGSFDANAKAAQLGLIPGGTYHLDLFYAHRGAGHDAGLGVQITPAAVCSAIGTSTPIALNTLTPAGTAGMSGGALRLTTAGAPAVAGAAWTPQPIVIGAGFSAAFNFRVQPGSGGANGLAFVLQNNAAPAVGGTGSNLGYWRHRQQPGHRSSTRTRTRRRAIRHSSRCPSTPTQPPATAHRKRSRSARAPATTLPPARRLRSTTARCIASGGLFAAGLDGRHRPRHTEPARLR